MTNTSTAKTATKAVPQDAPATSWDMSCSILVGLYKAIKLAHQERADILAAADNNPFAPGISQANQTAEALSMAKLSLEADMHRLARTSGLAMPEIQR